MVGAPSRNTPAWFIFEDSFFCEGIPPDTPLPRSSPQSPWQQLSSGGFLFNLLIAFNRAAHVLISRFAKRFSEQAKLDVTLQHSLLEPAECV